MEQLTLVNREQLSLSGITNVKTTEPTQIVATLVQGLIIITGQNLSVQNLSVTQGTLELTGRVDGIRFTKSHSRKFSLKNMFR